MFFDDATLSYEKFKTFNLTMFPFVAGATSSVKGIQILSYITVPLAAILTVIWALLSSRLPVGQVCKEKAHSDRLFECSYQRF
jgi:hypothetical protein